MKVTMRAGTSKHRPLPELFYDVVKKTRGAVPLCRPRSRRTDDTAGTEFRGCLSIKAEAVAQRAVQRLQEGKKPVIAFASTMGSFLESMENQHGEPISDGDMINADFSEVLTMGLESLFLITEIDANGNRKKKRLSLAALPEEAHRDYNQLLSAIRTISTGISISPIDNIKFHIEQAGYSVAEESEEVFAMSFGEVNIVPVIRSTARTPLF